MQKPPIHMCVKLTSHLKRARRDGRCLEVGRFVFIGLKTNLRAQSYFFLNILRYVHGTFILHLLFYTYNWQVGNTIGRNGVKIALTLLVLQWITALLIKINIICVVFKDNFDNLIFFKTCFKLRRLTRTFGCLTKILLFSRLPKDKIWLYIFT